MNPSRPTRRLVAGATGLLLGAAGALAFASPASAHFPTVKGDAVCDGQTGDWVITWEVFNSEDDLEGELTAVTVTPQPEPAFTTIVVGAALPVEGDGPLQEVQRVPGDTTEASLEVEVTWIRDYQKIVKKDKKDLRLGGDCAPPGGTFEFDCETLTITVTNPTKEELTLTLVPSVGDAQEVTVAGGESATAEFPSSEGLTVEIQLDGEPVELDEPIQITSEEWAALECDDDGEGGGLPETGASTGLIAGGALALLALGGGLFLVAQRRRVTFTA